MNTTPENIGFGVSRRTITREQLEFLSETKKLNGGRIYATVEAARTDPMFENMDLMELVEWSELCDQRLKDWGTPVGTFAEITPS